MAISARAAALGQRGEDLAVAHIEELGWEVLDRNWRCRQGELDIVAWERATESVVVVEVKCRSSRDFGDPLEALTDDKTGRLVRLAVAWLQDQEVRAARLRVDAIGIVLPRSGEPTLTHLKGLGGW